MFASCDETTFTLCPFLTLSSIVHSSVTEGIYIVCNTNRTNFPRHLHDLVAVSNSPCPHVMWRLKHGASETPYEGFRVHRYVLDDPSYGDLRGELWTRVRLSRTNTPVLFLFHNDLTIVVVG